MKLYVITNWNTCFENNRSRGLKTLFYVPVPNSHDGENYSLIMEQENAAEIYTAWMLMIQVASKCEPRGTLVRGNGEPHDSASLARKTRGKKEWFDQALDFLTKHTDWIECQEVAQIPHPGAGSVRDDGTQVPDQCTPVRTTVQGSKNVQKNNGAVNGKQSASDGADGSVNQQLTEIRHPGAEIRHPTDYGMEWNGMEKRPPKSPGGGQGAVPDLAQRIGRLFKRKPTTRWTEKELKALKANVAGSAEEDISLIEEYYSAEIESSSDIRRRDVQTLLNNWPGEVDRARAWKSNPERVTIGNRNQSPTWKVLEGLKAKKLNHPCNPQGPKFWRLTGGQEPTVEDKQAYTEICTRIRSLEADSLK